MMFIIIKEEGASMIQEYVGVPYHTESAARQVVFSDFYANHSIREHHKIDVRYFENKTFIRFVSEETGEIFTEYYILVIDF